MYSVRCTLVFNGDDCDQPVLYHVKGIDYTTVNIFLGEEQFMSCVNSYQASQETSESKRDAKKNVCAMYSS